MRIKCPHCGSKATIRTSRPLSEMTQEHQVQCTNVDCSHSWVAHTSAVRTIAPSMTPNPKVFIPFSKKLKDVAAAASQLALPMDHPHPRAMAAPDSG